MTDIIVGYKILLIKSLILLRSTKLVYDCMTTLLKHSYILLYYYILLTIPYLLSLISIYFILENTAALLLGKAVTRSLGK